MSRRRGAVPAGWRECRECGVAIPETAGDVTHIPTADVEPGFVCIDCLESNYEDVIDDARRRGFW